MQRGDCIGVTGAGDCEGIGWTPAWWVEGALLTAEVDALVPEADDRVCPFCVTQRARDANIINQPRRNAIRAALFGLHCFANPAFRPDHVHVFNLDDELSWTTRSHPAAPTRQNRSI